jgi:hypothetical protein
MPFVTMLPTDVIDLEIMLQCELQCKITCSEASVFCRSVKMGDLRCLVI